MTYAPHWLLSWGGPLGTQGEVWNNSLRLKAPDGMTFGNEIPDIPAALEDAKTDLTTLINASGSGYSGMCKMTYVKLNPIDENGRYDDPSTTHALYFEEAPIANARTVGMPIFNAVCVSFMTDRQRGAASKGRLYVPWPSITPQPSTSRFTDTQCTEMANAFAQFLTNINNWPGFDPANSPNAAIVSNVGAPGPWENITGVRVGDVPDVQRRRKNALVEAYHEATTEVVL